MMGDDFALVSFYTSLQKRRRVTSVFRKHCSFYERKENTHEYCTRPWCLGRRLLLERRHRAPAGRRLHRHRTPVSADVARLRQVLARQNGPTIVVGHSYGGQIMTPLGTDAPNVVGLVYSAATRGAIALATAWLLEGSSTRLV